MHIECGFDNQPELLVAIGPTLGVKIGFDPNFRFQKNSSTSTLPNLPNNQYHALIDTGATLSCIDSKIATVLRLPVIDRSPISGVHGSAEVNVYLAQVHIPSLNHILYGSFHGVDLHAGGQPHSVLLGREFLRDMEMIYYGNTGSVSISHFSNTK